MFPVRSAHSQVVLWQVVDCIPSSKLLMSVFTSRKVIEEGPEQSLTQPALHERALHEKTQLQATARVNIHSTLLACGVALGVEMRRPRHCREGGGST